MASLLRRPQSIQKAGLTAISHCRISAEHADRSVGLPVTSCDHLRLVHTAAADTSEAGNAGVRRRFEGMSAAIFRAAQSHRDLVGRFGALDWRACPEYDHHPRWDARQRSGRQVASLPPTKAVVRAVSGCAHCRPTSFCHQQPVPAVLSLWSIAFVPGCGNSMLSRGLSAIAQVVFSSLRSQKVYATPNVRHAGTDKLFSERMNVVSSST